MKNLTLSQKYELLQHLKQQCQVLINSVEQECELDDILHMIVETCKEIKPSTRVKDC